MIKLIKIKELEDALYPNNIKEGEERFGHMSEEPIIGKPFIIFKGFSSFFRTSIVQEIIDKDTFRTLNSIYKIIRNETN